MSRWSATPLDGRTMHMVGIGGAGVSGLAQLCRAWGADVSGCDSADSTYARLVRSHGVSTMVGHDPEHLREGMELIVSSAIDSSNPELERARTLGLDVRLRGDLLGELTRLRRTVVVAGAHGKSTTTAMVSHAAIACGLDPSVVLGAMMDGLAGSDGQANVRVGRGPWLVVEGDESDRTLLGLAAEVAVVTNIERDHHHTFATEEDVDRLFADWISSLQPDVVLVAGPGERLDALAGVAAADGRRVVRFGDDAEELAALEARLPVPGRHNALNASAALRALEVMGADPEACVDALSTFPGIGRRLERLGSARGVQVVDDYAHHPTEVAATVEAARQISPRGQVGIIFQPHLFSRTRELHREFAMALAAADAVWLLPVYGAREAPEPGVGSGLIATELERTRPGVFRGLLEIDPGRPVTGELATITAGVESGDVLVTMGAGNVTELAPRLVNELAGGAGPGDAGAGGRGGSTPPPPSWIEHDVPLGRFTTIGTGGPARWLAKAASDEQLEEALAWARDAGIPFALLGLGSNSLIVDEGFDGLAIKLVGELAAIGIDADDARITCGGGASLAAIVRRCRDLGLTGCEFACAIPGTAGGAVKMNAGAYGGEMSDVLVEARVVTADGVRTVAASDLAMTYRHTNLGWHEVVSRVVMQLSHADPEVVTATVKQMQGRRSAAQPRAARTFGSVFQNPTPPARSAPAAAGAGALIEAAGLKGHVIGGACISPKHGNFIENTGDATTADIIELIMLARERVHADSGITLHTEVHLLDRTGYRPLFDDRALVR